MTMSACGCSGSIKAIKSLTSGPFAKGCNWLSFFFADFLKGPPLLLIFLFDSPTFLMVRSHTLKREFELYIY